MFRNLKHLAKAVGNIVAISYEETKWRIDQASNATESVTSKLEAKSEELRKSYQKNLSDRKAGITTTPTPEVVKADQIPENITPVN